MSKCQGKGVRQTVNGFLSGARKVVHPREDDTFFAGSSSGSRRSQLLSHVEAKDSSQQRRPVSEVLDNIFM
jgi:hypothetical protein